MPDPSNKKIGEILVENGLITPGQLQEALEEQKTSGAVEKLGDILVKKGWISREKFQHWLAVQTGIDAFNLSNYLVDPGIVKLVPEEFADKYKLLPLFVVENTLTVAMAEPHNIIIIDELQKLTKLNIEPVLADEIEIRKAQNQYYKEAGTLREIIASIDKDKLSEGEKLGEDAPIIKIVNYLIAQAVQCQASDIHIEPEERLLNVRYRADGKLRRQHPLPKDISFAILSRFKIMAGLDISEKRLPQDGRIFMRVGNKEIDFRVSTCPTIHGENVVLRILDKSGLVLDLGALGFPPDDLEIFEEMINSPYGIILVTGPTGSGKTTTLYSALRLLNKEDVNIMAVEDPVEYQFSGIRQVEVNTRSGLTFAAALRSFLRQDPDIIMIREIPDLETAEIAVQSALTGHLVFSTLHTNDASSAFTRLMDIGIEPFLLSSSLLGVLAQRLIRKVCAQCKEFYIPANEILAAFGLQDKMAQGIKFSRGKGCKLCGQTGYKGRIGIYELLKITPGIQDLVLKKASSDEIREAAVRDGMRTLRQAAIEKMSAGITTPEEVVRVTLETG